MRSSAIVGQSCLGDFNGEMKLKAGDAQSMVLTKNDLGPFWLSKNEKNELKRDQGLGLKHKELSKKELITSLSARSVGPTRAIADLQQKCRANEIEWRVSSMGNCSLEKLKQNQLTKTQRTMED